MLVCAKFGTCTVVSVKGTLVEAKMCTSTLEFTHFIFNKCAIYTHDGARVPNLGLTLSHTKRITVCLMVWIAALVKSRWGIEKSMATSQQRALMADTRLWSVIGSTYSGRQMAR